MTKIYLNSNPDVKAAVQSGAIASGLEHFQKYGLAEGRVAVSPYYDEGLYLRKYADVAVAVKPGGFKTGLQHYIQYGEAEGRSPGNFNEQYYRQTYPDVDAAIAVIKNFERGKDAITLAGTLSSYNLQPVNGNLNISTTSGDLIGIVEGVTSLSRLPDNNLGDGTFYLG